MTVCAIARRAAAAAAIAAALAAPACRTGDTADPSARAALPAESSPVVAEIDGQPITEAELDAWIRDDLFRQATRDNQASRVYDLRSRALDRLIDERVLDAETRRRNLSTEELLDQELAARGGVSEQEIADFYEGNKAQLGGASLDSMRGRIESFLQQQRRGEVVAELRERADVAVLLEPVRLDVAAEGPSLGPESAPVTIIEFSDFQCPYCQRANPVMKELLGRYPDDVRLVYRHLPLGSHARARPAAEAAVCAEGQGEFWAYHDLLFANPRKLADEDLLRYAGDLGLDVPRFQECLAEGEARTRVERDAEAARSAGITSTPSFLVNGVLVSGAQPAAAFVEVIESELGRAEQGG